MCLKWPPGHVRCLVASLFCTLVFLESSTCTRVHTLADMCKELRLAGCRFDGQSLIYGKHIFSHDADVSSLSYGTTSPHRRYNVHCNLLASLSNYIYVSWYVLDVDTKNHWANVTKWAHNTSAKLSVKFGTTKYPILGFHPIPQHAHTGDFHLPIQTARPNKKSRFIYVYTCIFQDDTAFQRSPNIWYLRHSRFSITVTQCTTRPSDGC
jgi:hypothetical protein